MPGTAGPRIGLTWGYSPGDDGWGVGGFNPNFARLETLVHLTVYDVANTPPASPVPGECYIVGSAPTGAWAGFPQTIAAWYTTGTPAWQIIYPPVGTHAYNLTTSSSWLFDGTVWVERRSGDMTGPATSVAGHLPSYTDTGGDLLDDSGIPAAAVLQKSGTLPLGHLLSADASGRAVDSGMAVGGIGTGDVTGPASAVSGNLSSYGSTTGKAIVDSGVPATGVLQKTGTLTNGHLLSADASGKAVDSGILASSVGSGTGDVVGPASSVSGHLAVFSGTTGKLLADGGAAMPAGTSQYDTLVWSGSAWQVQRPRWGVGAFVPLVLTASQDLLYHRFDAATTIPANFGAYLGHASQAGGSAVATASTVITVSKALSASPTSFSSVGSITFAAGTMTPTFASSGGAAITFAQGDILRLQGPATPDTTFAGFHVTLAGYQT